MPHHPRILICRLSALGDCILTTPLLNAVRDIWPQSWIGWAIEPAAAALLEHHRGIDEWIIVRKSWLKSPSEIGRLRRELRSRRFDVALDPQSLTKSSLLAWLSGAPVRIGFAAPRGRELSVYCNNVRVAPTAPHLADAQLELLTPLGVRADAVRFDLPRDAAAAAMVEQALRQAHLQPGFVAVNPGAGWDSRLWPAERYGKVARHLGERWKIPSLATWSGERERAWAEQIVQHAAGHAVLAPRTQLKELTEVMRRAGLYLGSDTGPMHLAAAVGTRCVALYGPTRPEASGAYGRQHLAVQARYQQGSARQRRRANNAAMREISVDDVCAACESALGLGERISPPRAA